MSTIRVARRRRYTAVDRRPINDERLSFKARGLLVWLLDKPDDWEISIDAIAGKVTTDGTAAVRSAMKELEALGYLVRRRYREGGRYQVEHRLYEHPELATQPQLQDAETEPGDTTAPDAEIACGDPPPPPAKNHGGKPHDQELKTDTENGSKTPAPDGAAPVDELAERRKKTARQITDRVFELKNPKPVQKWIAIQQLADRFLNAGHRAVAIEAAMIEAPTITIAAVELQLSRAHPTASPHRGIDSDRGGPDGRIEL